MIEPGDRHTADARRDAMAVLDAWVSSPAEGLPEEFFVWISRFTPLINVDLFIKDEREQTLLTWRDDEFYGSGWHVPGGIIRYGETAEARIHATAIRELGADVSFEPAPMAIEQAIENGRRERGHFISLVYRCRLLETPDERLRLHQGDAPRAGQWAWHRNCPADLIKDQVPYRRFF